MKNAFRPEVNSWSGIEPKGYRAGRLDEPGQGYSGVTKHVISGDRGEPSAFEVRYFEVEPNGHTRLEKHQHVHSVTVIRGTGVAIVGEDLHRLHQFDHIYVGPMTLHQFINDGDEPFGFICVVDADRDKPQAATDEEYAALLRAPALDGMIRR
jgi:quercetin dioxygenase-like cupin family protein